MTLPDQSNRAAHPWERLAERLKALPRYIAVVQPDGFYVGKLDQQQPVLHSTVRYEAIEEALDAEVCGLCGGYGAANGKTREPVPCIACGKRSEGLVLTALDPPDDDLLREQRFGLRLIDGGKR